MMTDSLQSLLYRRLDAAPDGRALAWYGPGGTYRWMPYGELASRAAGYAARLAEEGLGPGDVCVIVLPSDERAALLVLASLFAGAVPLLVAPPLLQGVHSALPETLRYTLRRTRARIAILPSAMSENFSPTWRAGRTRVILDDVFVRGGTASATPRVLTAPETAAMQLTSGTTGRPRICVWRQGNVLAGLDGMHAAMQLQPDDVCFNWTPLYHDMGLMNNFLLCVTHGIPLVMLNPFDFIKRPALWLRGLSDTGSTVTWSPNFGFALAAQRIPEGEIAGVSLAGVRAFWNAAERIHLETLQAFHARFARYGLRFEALKTNFGCAENVGGATFSDPQGVFPVEVVDRELLQKRRTARVLHPGNGAAHHGVTIVGVGRPYPGMAVRILSPRGKLLPDGAVGEIALQTPSRMAGYLGDVAQTKRSLFNDLLRTGDLGYVRGGELFWVGRVKERITVRGRKLDPSDFEPVLQRVEGLRQGSFAVFGIDAAARGTQQVIIVAEVRDPPGRSAAEISEDIGHEIFVHLGVTADEILLVRPGTLTKTSSGKRRHRYFRRLYQAGGLQPFLIGEPREGAR